MYIFLKPSTKATCLDLFYYLFIYFFATIIKHYMHTRTSYYKKKTIIRGHHPPPSHYLSASPYRYPSSRITFATRTSEVVLWSGTHAQESSSITGDRASRAIEH